MHKRSLLLIPVILVAGCVGRREPDPPPPPAPQPQVLPAPAPAPTPPPSPAPTGWADLPLTPGSWTYAQTGGDSTASYGPADAPVFTVRCDKATRNVSLQRVGASGGGAMSLRTSFGARTLPVTPDAAFANATLPARDPFLDGMIFSRGRISVEMPGAPMLVLPSWAEPARVVEDCRK